MSRKHFQALADELKAVGADLVTCQAVARACRQFNSNFDTYRFLKACGQEG
jgi:hypothetical protein